jgi:sulfotransferase
MVEKIFFQSSLTRSGSTLLQNILAQNPDIHATPTSGILDILGAARNIYTTVDEFKAQDDENMKKGMAGLYKQGLFGFYNNVTNRKYVIDKSRGWGVHYNFINSFYPNPKILCMVRDPKDIYTSMEKAYRNNPERDSGIINAVELKGTTLEKRLAIYANNPPTGLAFDRLKDILQQKLDKHILFIKYENLTSNPTEEIKRVYDYLEIPHYEHDFNNVEQYTHENDRIHGIFGDHQIQSKITYKPSQAVDILGQEICNILRNDYIWFYQYFNY